LISDVQPSAADDGMRPAREAVVGELETPLLLVSRRRRFGEPEDVVFALQIQMAVRVDERPLANAAIAPHHLSGPELEARQNGIVEAVEIAVHEHDAAVVVLHLAREVNLLRLYVPAL